MNAKNKSILLVDDDPDIQLLYTSQLERAGYEVRSACDGTSCLVAAKRDLPDLVILDLGLPAGDGETALRNLRASADLAHTPILILSAREAADWAPHALSLGANAYLQKPARPETVVTKVRELLSPAPAPVAPATAVDPQQIGTLACPHCGHTVAALQANLDPRVAAALARAS